MLLIYISGRSCNNLIDAGSFCSDSKSSFEIPSSFSQVLCLLHIYIYEQYIFEKTVMLFLNDLYNRVIYSSVLEGKLSSTD